MNKTFTIILGSMLVAGCKNSETQPKAKLPETKVINSTLPVETDLFLGLDTKLTQKEFNIKLDSLERNGRLIDGKFIIKLAEVDVLFTISKTDKSIILSSDVIKQKKLRSLDHRDFTRLEYENFREIVEEFRDYFENKYKNYSGETLDLSSYGFKKKYNHIYLAPSKSIVIGYTLIPDHYDFPSADPYNKKFGYMLEINYFHNNDFEDIYKSAMDIKKSKDDRNNDIIEEKNRIELKKKENIKEL